VANLRAWLAAHWPWLGLAGIVVLYTAIQAAYFTPACSEPDTAGYLALAERMAAGGPLAVADDDPFQYQSHVWVENLRGEVVPKYPPGLPALMAVGLRLAGEPGAWLVSPLAGILALIGAFVLFGLWLPPVPRLCAVAALAFHHGFLVYTNYPLAHAVDMAAAVWGMAGLWYWRRRPSVGSGLLAGLALSLAVLTRPTSVLLVLVAIPASAIGWRGATAAGRRPWWPLVALLGALALGPLLLGWYNHALFGSAWVTGYALSLEQDAFSWALLLQNYDWTFAGLAGQLAWCYFPLGLVGMCWRGCWGERLMRLLWWVPTWLLYASYYWTFQHMGMAFFRFYLVFLPLLVGCAFGLLHDLAGTPRARTWLAVAVLALVLAVDSRRAFGGLARTVAGTTPRAQLLAAEQAAAHLPEGAYVFAREPAHQRLGRQRGFRLYHLAAFDPGYLNTQPFQDRPDNPRTQPLRLARLRQYYQEHAAELGDQLRAKVHAQWARGGAVAVLIPVHDERREQRRFGPGIAWRQVSTWEAPNQQWEQIDGRWQPTDRPLAWGLYLLTAEAP
jgi:hypothetical protein